MNYEENGNREDMAVWLQEIEFAMMMKFFKH